MELDRRGFDNGKPVGNETQGSFGPGSSESVPARTRKVVSPDKVAGRNRPTPVRRPVDQTPQETPRAFFNIAERLGYLSPEVCSLQRALDAETIDVEPDGDETTPVPTALDNVIDRLGGAFTFEAQALQRAMLPSVPEPPALPVAPSSNRPAIEAVVGSLGGSETPEAQALWRANEASVLKPESNAEQLPLPEHGVDKIAPFVQTHGKIHPSGSYHSNASFENIDLYVNPSTGDFIVVGNQRARTKEDDPTTDYVIIDPGTGTPIAEPARTIWRVSENWVDTNVGDERKMKVVAAEDAEVPNWQDRLRFTEPYKRFDITEQLPTLTPDALVDLAGSMVTDGVQPRLALRGVIDDARAQGHQPKPTTPLRSDFKKSTLNQPEYARLNQVRVGLNATVRLVSSLIPRSVLEMEQQSSITDALNFAADGFKKEDFADYSYWTDDPKTVTNVDIEDARNAVRRSHGELWQPESSPKQTIIENYFEYLITQAEANGGFITADKINAKLLSSG